VSKEPKKSVDATIDFLDIIVKGHWLACAHEILGITNLDAPFTLPSHVLKGTPREQLTCVQGIAQKVVDRLTLVNSASLDDDPNTNGDNVDKVFNYTRVLWCSYN